MKLSIGMQSNNSEILLDFEQTMKFKGIFNWIAFGGVRIVCQGVRILGSVRVEYTGLKDAPSAPW